MMTDIHPSTVRALVERGLPIPQARTGPKKSRAEQIAELYPKIERRPGRGCYVCKKCGLVNLSKNPWHRNDHILDELVTNFGSIMLLDAVDDPQRPAASADNLRGHWDVKPEDADFCLFEDYRQNKGGKRWDPKGRWVALEGREDRPKTKSNGYWVGDYVDTEADPYLFYEEGVTTDRSQYNTFKKWVKLQTEPEQDLQLRMTMYPGQTLADRFKRLVTMIREQLPEDRIDQVICHLTRSHQWEGESEI